MAAILEVYFCLIYPSFAYLFLISYFLFRSLKSWDMDSINFGFPNGAEVDLKIAENFEEDDLVAFLKSYADSKNLGGNILTSKICLNSVADPAANWYLDLFSIYSAVILRCVHAPKCCATILNTIVSRHLQAKIAFDSNRQMYQENNIFKVIKSKIQNSVKKLLVQQCGYLTEVT